MDMVVVLVVVVLTGLVEALAMAELVEFQAMVVVVPVGTEYTGVWLLLRVPSQTRRTWRPERTPTWWTARGGRRWRRGTAGLEVWAAPRSPSRNVPRSPTSSHG